MTAGSGYRVLSRADAARAVPSGSRRIRSQREALRRGLACPDLAGVRADFRGHLSDWWRVHVFHASWGGAGRPPPGTTEPTRARVCELAAMSPSTYKACRRWWESRGYIAIARPGATPDLRPGALSSPADGNVRQAYVLCVPRGRRPAPRRAGLPPLTRPLSKSRRDSDRFPAREERQEDENGKTPGPGIAPRSPLLSRGPLAALTDGWLAHLTAPFAGWSASDLVWAIDHEPSGRQHRTRLANVRHPAGWLRWRLGHWLNPDGTARPSPAQQRAEAAARHREYLAERDRQLGLAQRRAQLRAMYHYDHASPADTLGACSRRHNSTAVREPRLAGWAASRTGRCAEAAPELPAWWAAKVAAAAAAITAQEAAPVPAGRCVAGKEPAKPVM